MTDPPDEINVDELEPAEAVRLLLDKLSAEGWRFTQGPGSVLIHLHPPEAADD